MDRITSKQLREERAGVVHKLRSVVDKITADKRDFTAEERQEYDRLNAEVSSLGSRIQAAEQVEDLESDLQGRADNRSVGREDYSGKGGEKPDTHRRQKPTEEDRAIALQAWCRHQSGLPLKKRHAEAAKKVGLSVSAREIAVPLRRDYAAMRDQVQGRALSAQSDSAGAYTFGSTFVGSLEKALLDFGGVRRAAQVIRTSSGEEMQWPTVNDTSNKGVRLGENQAVSEQDVTFGQIRWQAFKYTSKLVKVPYELMQDSAFDMSAELGRLLGERLGRITNDEYTTGTGANQPKGIVTASTLGKTTASGTAITADEILDLVYSVDPAYREGAGFMAHDNIVLAIRKLKDGNGAYLWQPSIQVGTPDRLWNYPLFINMSMQSSVATATKTMLFGQLSKYKIRDVGSIRLRRLVERYADNDQEGFVAFLRTDGNLLDAGVAPVKHMLQA